MIRSCQKFLGAVYPHLYFCISELKMAIPYLVLPFHMTAGLTVVAVVAWIDLPLGLAVVALVMLIDPLGHIVA
jgi:hypothetical protein